MKNKGLTITAIVFFLLVNTTYYWEGKLGFFAIPSFLILAGTYLGLAISFFGQIYLTIKERFKRKERLLTLGLLATVLLLTFYKPFGLVDFEKFERDNVLVADREGAANCLTTLKLKDDFTFKERIGCFGISETTGTYRFINDTIYFDNIDLGRHEESFYKFAIIKSSKSNNTKILGELIRYKDLTDTIGHELWITKNDLSKLKEKKPNR